MTKKSLLQLFILAAAVAAASAVGLPGADDDANECNLDDPEYTGAFDFDDYHDLDTLNDYIDFLSTKYRVKTENIGYSYNGVPMQVVKICDDECGDRYGMWIDAASHGNEWVSSAAAMYLVQELAANTDYRTLRYDLDWYILVVANPDGYEKSWESENTRDEGRKTQSPNAGSDCVGTNMNRNWGFQWGLEDASEDPCSENYRGDYAFSELENRHIADFILEQRGEDTPGQIVFSNSLHASGDTTGELILLPYGYTNYSASSFTLAQEGADAILAVDGLAYEIGTVYNLLGQTSGGSTDWMYNMGKVEYSYAMELRSSTAAYDPTEICVNAREVMAFHVAAANYVYDSMGDAEDSGAGDLTSPSFFMVVAVTAFLFAYLQI